MMIDVMLWVVHRFIPSRALKAQQIERYFDLIAFQIKSLVSGVSAYETDCPY